MCNCFKCPGGLESPQMMIRDENPSSPDDDGEEGGDEDDDHHHGDHDDEYRRDFGPTLLEYLCYTTSK